MASIISASTSPLKVVYISEPWNGSPASITTTFSPASVRSSRRSLTAVATRATPPKHSPAASSSAEQVLSKRLIGWMRLWMSLVCRMWIVTSAEAAEPKAAIMAVEHRIRASIVTLPVGMEWCQSGGTPGASKDRW